MPSRNRLLAFRMLWWTAGILLFVYSVRTVISHLSAHEAGPHAHVAFLGAAEAVAALLFLLPRTMRTGGIALLAIFLIAFLLHAVRGEFASQLLLYAAAVGFVVVHGLPPAAGATASRNPGATP